jgi:hypothetical protein
VATWQFDMHLLPIASVSRAYGTTPLIIPRSEFDSQVWWEGVDSPSALRAHISRFLPPLQSWNKATDRWGIEDGDRIDISWENDSIASIFVRIDLRSMSQTFLAEVIGLARASDCLLRIADGRLLRPSMAKLLSAIHTSPAFRFVTDPVSFLRDLDCALKANK